MVMARQKKHGVMLLFQFDIAMYVAVFLLGSVLLFASRFGFVMFVAYTVTCISVQMCLCHCIGPIPHVGNQCVAKLESLCLPFHEFPNIA